MNKLLIVFALALALCCAANADDTARAGIHIPAGFAITYGSHLFWNKAVGLDSKAFAIGWGVISTAILGAMWEAGGGQASDHHVATAMGFNLLGAGLAIIPILFDSTSSPDRSTCAMSNGDIRIPVAIFDK